MNPMKIYVAGPYSNDDAEHIEKNVNSAIDTGIELFYRGHFPYVPHLTHHIDSRAKDLKREMTWEDFIEWDMPWLESCDALLYLAPSKGADLELAKAKSLGKKIFYEIDEIPDLKGKTK